MKTGIRTSEFWLTALTVVGAASATLADKLDPKYAAVAATVGTIAYTLSRGLVKGKENQPVKTLKK